MHFYSRFTRSDNSFEAILASLKSHIIVNMQFISDWYRPVLGLSIMYMCRPSPVSQQHPGLLNSVWHMQGLSTGGLFIDKLIGLKTN